MFKGGMCMLVAVKGVRQGNKVLIEDDDSFVIPSEKRQQVDEL